MSSPAAPDSPPIDGSERDHFQHTSCAVCHAPIWGLDYVVTAASPVGIDATWSLCDACYWVLVATLKVEVEYGPGTPPPQAWTKVRKLRAARHRRWGKADP